MNDDLPEEVRQLLEVAPGELDANGFYASRQLEDGRWLAIMPLSFRRASVGVTLGPHDGIGTAATWSLEAALAYGYGFQDVWEFPTLEAARAAVNTWPAVGEPHGWSRHPGTSRRRRKDGAVMMRPTEIPEEKFARLRQAVSNGAAHECDEWRLERAGEDTQRCALCDRALPPIAAEKGGPNV